MNTEKNKPKFSWIKPLTEYGPLVVFLAAYYQADLFVATGALMAATAIALVISLIINRRVPMMPVITAVVVGIFGGLTLFFNDDTFIKMKPTIVQILFAAILLGGLLFRKALLKPVMGAAWPMTDQGWHFLSRNFGIFFLVMAVVNEFVWRTQTEEFWVNFKVWGSIGLMLLFSLTQAPLLNRYKIETHEN
ncbi:MAG: putative intracellular septation protein A [Alphaproteobacteria bacterium MarineAlpha11_Bin1]|nr:MAG: putative intracellular septation protein A [Alphaproteobacteria bacterium MarineAlpha11_Bin1]|tara:strand:- start:6053 stop:6625 length:573 start_codon:yes stop_codon:yes gene_type:complete